MDSFAKIDIAQMFVIQKISCNLLELWSLQKVKNIQKGNTSQTVYAYFNQLKLVLPLDYIQHFWLEVLSSSSQVCTPSLQ